MKLQMFSIRDAKGEVFNTPFFQKTFGEAERSFTQLINDGKSLPGQYPDDFDLYYLGDYDDQTGKFAPLDTPQHLVKAVQVLQKKQAPPLQVQQ